jgi:guanylate kinase
LDNISNLVYFPTITTRTPRSLQELNESYEYTFVSIDQYNQKRHTSLDWMHYEINENYYGCDRGLLYQLIWEGKNVILNLSLQNIKSTRKDYICEKIYVLIDTDKATATARILKDRPATEKNRISRELKYDLANLIKEVDIIFNPTNDIQTDKTNFLELIKKLLT